MTLARCRVAVLAAIAVAASILAYAPAAAAQTTPAQSQHAGVHQPSVDALAKFGVETGVDVFAGTGCVDSDELCPGERLLRWEMAVWLVRVLDRADPPAISSSRFADVDASAWWAPHAERLAELGIVMECKTEPLRFCPGDPISRGQTAAILVMAFDLPPAERAWFVDVNTEHPFAEAIDRLAGWGVTAGCRTDPARYCPEWTVSRAQMATFLARALRRVDLPPPVATTYEPAQDDTQLPADPDVVIGTLDNGLTYYLRPNDKPGKNLAVRLLVNVGAVDETDEEAGIGHFVEHMLFNGTSDYPGNSLVEALREIGVGLGPDIGAHVTTTRPSTRLQCVSTPPTRRLWCSTPCRRWPARPPSPTTRSIPSGAWSSTRCATGARPSTASSAPNSTGLHPGHPYEGRDPAGTIDTVNSITPEMLRAFYEKWYVPSNMAVVAVGAMTVEDLEALVDEHFGALPSGEGRQPPSVDIPPAASSSHVVTDPRQGVTFISLDIPIDPHDLSTVGGDRLATMESLIEVMIDNRLNDAYHRGELSQVDPPRFFSFTYNRGLRYYGTNWQGDNLDTASADYLSVLLTAQEHGFTAGDLGRAIEQIVTSLRFQLSNAPTHPGRSMGRPVPGALLLRGRHRLHRRVGDADRHAAGGDHTRGADRALPIPDGARRAAGHRGRPPPVQRADDSRTRRRLGSSRPRTAPGGRDRHRAADDCSGARGPGLGGSLRPSRRRIRVGVRQRGPSHVRALRHRRGFGQPASPIPRGLVAARARRTGPCQPSPPTQCRAVVWETCRDQS